MIGNVDMGDVVVNCEVNDVISHNGKGWMTCKRAHTVIFSSVFITRTRLLQQYLMSYTQASLECKRHHRHTADQL